MTQIKTIFLAGLQSFVKWNKAMKNLKNIEGI